MRKKYIPIVIAVLVLASALAVWAASGTLDSSAPPASTNSYTLEDIYDRLDTGAAGTQSTFTEPSSGPVAGTMHTLNEIIGLAPAVDDTNGAAPAEVLIEKTYWGLRTGGTWGPQTGTMPNNGAVIIPPTTVDQTIAAGYHNGSGYVEGDANLVPGNIKQGVNLFGVDGTLYEAGVPKTGQTGCWDGSGNPVSCSGTGQDGEYQKGVAWPSPRFTDNDNGTVTDNLTGLIWLKNANCFGERTWAQALSDANGLAAGYCGLVDGSSAGDWRLPNVRELQSLIDYGRYSPALPSGHPFTGVQSSGYWSSTAYAADTSYAWYVHLYDGFVNANVKAVTYSVWPVRGGQ